MPQKRRITSAESVCASLCASYLHIFLLYLEEERQSSLRSLRSEVAMGTTTFLLPEEMSRMVLSTQYTSSSLVVLQFTCTRIELLCWSM